MRKNKLLALLIGMGSLLALAKLDQPYYGTNYTVPFAHAYRALNSLGVDHHKAIDRDVYHMGRLGLNAFRLHIWDVEISDSTGNLIDNEHLELLDYLIAAVEKQGMKVMLTAQTNFGNGYPERNTDPNNAYSYDYDKCRIHDDPKAQDAQERYLSQLARHRNRYNGHTYAEDPDILMMEINNEPCHSGTQEEITAYVNRMAKALRRSGWKKDIVYNVSHNLDRTQAFYDADVDGTTYQWYPTGLVHGQRRKGNFLPCLDNYNIPFDTIRGFDRMPKIIYEYDPGDVLETYLYPAATRTLRKAGFDWITQFAYDPIDMARFNSEYQTHFLNLAYTPGKAIGMAIAAEVARQIPKGTDYGTYPADTVFGNFNVSARRNLAMLNDGVHYYHTNHTDSAPLDTLALKSIKGVGNSSLVSTDGTGAYFIDRLDKDSWRLEIMPDVILTEDPFKRPSLKRSVAYISEAPVKMALHLPGLGGQFEYKGPTCGDAKDHEAILEPGVYILSSSPEAFRKWNATSKFGNGKLGDYVMPPIVSEPISVINHTPSRLCTGDSLTVTATIVGTAPVDSVKIFPSNVDFWKQENTTYTMRRSGKYGYTAEIGHPSLYYNDRSTYNLDDNDCFTYNIVVYSDGKATTYPGKEDGTPLDWDFAAGRESSRPRDYYSTQFSIPGLDAGVYDSTSGYDATDMEPGVISKYVGDIMGEHPELDGPSVFIRAYPGRDSTPIKVMLESRDGFSYTADALIPPEGMVKIPKESFKPSETYTFPEPFPAFIGRSFKPDAACIPALPSASEIERVSVFTDYNPLEFPKFIQYISIGN